MSTLISRFPSARRLQQPRTPGELSDPVFGDIERLIEPYLDWVLLEVDSGSTDILIGQPESVLATGQPRSLMILGGEAAQAWLRNVRKSAP